MASGISPRTASTNRAPDTVSDGVTDPDGDGSDDAKGPAAIGGSALSALSALSATRGSAGGPVTVGDGIGSFHCGTGAAPPHPPRNVTAIAPVNTASPSLFNETS
ncbi:hypothetical protein SAMN04489716_3363 [Actinoplanes derwentensis]|uniref:Uncharacterized protein n=1 Tax=Actinoplanes derwentensis TaxID=113562 RepID=A0A1H1ZJR2_9ACTN|nr:hypothetical protein Ade03nite_14070 [Actinoplanes derwentensis]SDT34061.1 hypothetical protein SAMN04489716_3363 [Actinoplanes derwentensis]